MTAGIGVASRFHRVLDKWLGQYPAAARPHIDGVIAQINADGTARVRKPGHQYASAYNYALPAQDPTRPWKVGDPVQLDESNSRRPRISTIPLPAVVTDQRFVVSASNPTLSWYTGGLINLRTQFNADPTGANDALAAWNAALASIPLSSSLVPTVIWLDPGYYAFSGPLSLPPNVWLMGPGKDLVTIYVSATGTTPLVTLGATLHSQAGTMTGIQGLTIYNSPQVGQTTPSTVQIASSNVIVGLRDVGFQGSGSGQGTSLEMLGNNPLVTLESLYFGNAGALAAKLCGRITATDCNFGGVTTPGGVTLTGVTSARFVSCKGMGAASSNPVTIQSLSTQITMTECEVLGDLVIDNSSHVTLIGTTVGGNLTEQNGADYTQLVYSPASGTLTLVGAHSFSLGPNNGGLAGLRLDVGSGYTPPLLNLNKAGTSEFSVDIGGNVTAAGDITPGSGHYLRGGGAKPMTGAIPTASVAGVAMSAGTTYGPYSGVPTGVPSGASAVFALVTSSAATNLAFYPATGWTPDPPGYSTFNSTGAVTQLTLIPLDGSGNFKVRCFTAATITVTVLGYLT